MNLQRFAPHLLLALTFLLVSSTAMAVPPAVPANFAASDGDFSNKIVLSWDDVADEDYYEVLVCVVSCAFLAQVSANVTSFDYTAATPGQAENFAVRSCKTGDDCSADSTRDVGFAKNGNTPPTFSIGSATGAHDSIVDLNLQFTAGWVGIGQTSVVVSWPAGSGQLATVACDVNVQTVGSFVQSCDYLPNGFRVNLSAFGNLNTGLAAALQIGIPNDAPSSTPLTISIEDPTNDAYVVLPADYVSVSAGTIDTIASGVPADERAALVNFYNATNGAGWDFTNEWLVGDPCVDGWYKVVCDANKTTVTGLDLPANQLSGSLEFNAPNLANLSNLTIFNVSHNMIGGHVPAELGSLLDLELLYLNGNQFNGSVPSQMTNLASLTDGTGLNINYNLLSATGGALDTFLDTKSGGDWSATQTVTPTGLQASGSNGTANLSFNLIEFSTGPGRYTIRYSTTQGGGPWTVAGSTDDKSESALQVPGLSNGVTYYFQVRAESDADVNNTASLISAYSSEVSLLMGIPQEVIFDNSFE